MPLHLRRFKATYYFRINMTGSSSPSIGLVYYHWSNSPDDPFEGLETDHFAAVKRYSLSAKQPGQDMYPNLQDVELQVANNKTNMIAPPSKALTADASGPWYLHSWTSDMSWDSARELMQYEKMKLYVEQNPAQYELWKTELPADSSEADRIVHANKKALQAVGEYDNWDMWVKDGEFMQDDSNWSYKMTPFLLDNKAPEITFNEVMGNNSMNVTVSATVQDEHSGGNQVQYQWVIDGAQPAEIDWRTATLAGGSFSVSTVNDIFEDGEYRLYIRASDIAGNSGQAFTSTIVLVNSEDSVIGGFFPDANSQYVKSHDIDFTITGAIPELIGYSLSTSPIRPEGDSSYTPMAALPDMDGTYRIAAEPSINGLYYVHVMAKEDNRYYYYSKAYYFDNQAPAVTFSINGVAYPLESHEVKVTTEEWLSSWNVVTEYQWVSANDNAPDANSGGWLDLPSSGKTFIDNSALSAGETADYRLYVKAVDGAGNVTLTSTSGIFKVSKIGGDLAPAGSANKLVYLYGDQTSGYTAILHLDLETVDKRGYEFTVSPDNGESWGKWRPYTNFASVNVVSGDASKQQIFVRYRTSSGVMSEPQSINNDTLLAQEPVYALASLNTTRPVTSEKGVEITVAPALGIRVSYSNVNPPEGAMSRKGNTFTVHANGYYAFDLTDLNDPAGERTEALYIVVNNVDDTAPQGTIEYLVTEVTNGNVNVRLRTSEPSKVTGLQALNPVTMEPTAAVKAYERDTYTFVQNGAYRFWFEDEAGNAGSADAIVSNINKTPPTVSIIRSYTYGSNYNETFGTLRDNNGDVLFSAGIRLNVNLPENAKVIMGGTLVKDSNGVTRLMEEIIARENGEFSFSVADQYGNVAVVSTIVNNILSTSVTPEHIQYTFVDSNGDPLPEEKIVNINGKPYAKGGVQVTLTGQTELPNAVFAGARPAMEDGEYLNRISSPLDGTYTYSRLFTAEGTTTIGLSDLLGNANKIPVTIKGLDNKAPELALNRASVVIEQNKADFDFARDLGGYSVSDNVSADEDIAVMIEGLDLTKLGRQTVTYRAVDQVGNETSAEQVVTVVADVGMLIMANGTLISGDSGETALFGTNKLTFSISRYNQMQVGGQDMINEWGTYELLYYSGLYREGQMKLIATKLSYKDLLNGQYKVAFPKAGWYTIVVRNQERERVYATFFISKSE